MLNVSSEHSFKFRTERNKTNGRGIKTSNLRISIKMFDSKT